MACHHECWNFIEVVHIFLDLLGMVLTRKDSFVFAEFSMEVPSCQFQRNNQKQILFRCFILFVIENGNDSGF